MRLFGPTHLSNLRKFSHLHVYLDLHISEKNYKFSMKDFRLKPKEWCLFHFKNILILRKNVHLLHVYSDFNDYCSWKNFPPTRLFGTPEYLWAPERISTGPALQHQWYLDLNKNILWIKISGRAQWLTRLPCSGAPSNDF